MAVGVAWFIAWSTGVLLLLGVLVAVNALAEYRRLTRARTPRPFFILWQRTVARLIPARADRQALEGRLVWLAWDVRWVASGRSTARTVALGDRGDIELRLDTPIVIHGVGAAHEVRLEIVRFVPRGRNVPGYGRRAVSGTLDPPIAPDLQVTAQVVVYPLGA